MSGLTGKFGGHFPEAAVAAGEALVSGGGFRLTLGSPDGVGGEAEDGSECSWRLEGRRLVPRCSCGEFAAGRLCAHLYAALLLAESQGELSEALKRSVSGRTLGSAGESAGAAGDLRYDYGQVRRSRGTEPAAGAVGGDGPRLEYERGAVRAGAVRPQVSVRYSGGACPAEILYLVRPPESGGVVDGLAVELWWKQAATAACKPFYLVEDAELGRREDVRLIDFLRTRRSGRPAAGSPGNVWFVPVAALAEFLDLARECGDRFRLLLAEDGRRRLHRLGILAGQPLRCGWRPAGGGSYLFEWRIGDFPPDRLLAVCPGSPGFALTRQALVFFDDRRAWRILEEAGAHPGPFPAAAALALNGRFARESALELESCPPELACRRLERAVQGRLFVRTALYKADGHEQLHADLTFAYGDVECGECSDQELLPGGRPGELVVRNGVAEEALRDQLRSVGFRWNAKRSREEIGWKLLPEWLEEAVFALVDQGWVVTAEGRTYRRPADRQLRMASSGQDWFELSGVVDFGDEELPLPLLLQRMGKGGRTVRLDDGTYGILPRDWLENFTALLELGEPAGDRIRLRRSQAAIVEALLADRSLEAAAQLEEIVRTWQERDAAARAAPPALPPGFRAELRPYQRAGLEWLVRMGRSGLGVCLADDMGLGKTVQVLAMLAVRLPELQRRPALVVLPKTLVFNWRNEAERFYPAFRCLVYQGAGRRLSEPLLARTDLVFTTYGTLRQDAVRLAGFRFSYCILDESQIIRNPGSSTAQACRLIRADHRLTMTGTPVENSLGDLFSQLDFLNPGLLGRRFASDFGGALRGLPPDKALRLRKAVRPFLLRRTKEEVARDLPPKTEQVLWCEMEPRQRERYEELKEYYRRRMGRRQAMEREGRAAGGGPLDVLAAILRLRQAACHPGLVDERYLPEESGKVQLLLERLEAVLDAGHRTLVFSQFTSFLHIVERELDLRHVRFCYLDGQTKDREELVRRFQEDPAIGCFLISLKAGGVGLNLTAADYIFLLDPWWNPAVEAQAVDRAYRIGQRRPVTAYRLITRDTVEEKVLMMQRRKRELARTVLGGAVSEGYVPTGAELRGLLDLD